MTVTIDQTIYIISLVLGVVLWILNRIVIKQAVWKLILRVTFIFFYFFYKTITTNNIVVIFIYYNK